MPNQKGSLKDRLRSWGLYLKYKIQMKKKKKIENKYRKQMERDLKKKLQISASGKYYSKPKVVGLTIVGLLLGFFEKKSDKQESIMKIENKVKKLETKVDVLTFEQRIQLTNEIEDEIIKLKFRNQFNKSFKTQIPNYEIKLQKIKNYNDYKDHRKVENESTKKHQSIQIDENIRTKDNYTPVLEVKVINKQIKEYQKKLQKINGVIKNTTDYNSLYELEFSIKQIKLKLNDLLIKYNNLRELPGFHNLENIINIEEIDHLDLRFNSSKINDQIKICNLYLDNIETIRKNILNKKEKNGYLKDEKKSNINLKQQEQKKVKKEDKKIDDKLLEVSLANKIILDSLSNERKKLAKFQHSISKMGVRQKKKNIFYYTKNILSSIINFSMSLFPFSFFKNKFIGGLVSGIIINNSLRSARKVLNPEMEIIYLLYNDFEKEISKTSDQLSSISYVCSDSLIQIREIRNSIYLQYGNDIEYSSLLGDYLKQLDNIEDKVLQHQQTICNLKQQVHITKEKNKQKIKEFR